MSIDARLPFGAFCRQSIAAYRESLKPASPSPAMIEEAIERCHTAWHDFRKVKREKRGPFVPPTPAEVTAYSIEIGWPIDGEEFCLAYEKKEWCTSGTTKMRNWKAGVRYWKRRKIRTSMTPNVARSKPVIQEPAGFEPWFRRTRPDTPFITWAKLYDDARTYLAAEMEKDRQ